MRRTAARALIVAMLLAATACAMTTGADGRRTAAVSIHLIAYQPDALRVTAGTTVTWTQRDAGFHTVTSGTATVDATGTAVPHPDGTFDSGKLATGKRFSFTFTRSGTYSYFCQIHPATMRGSVTAS